jgi:CheY-like chemotaxis protein
MEQEKQNVLLIEDDEACQRIMTHFLQKLDYKVDLVDEGQKAVKMVQNKQYDLILTDVRNKGLSGDKVIFFVRSKNDSKNAGTPIIVWSAFVNKKNEEMYLNWGADAALIKVCKLHDVKKTIDECSGYRRYEREFYHRINIIKKKWQEDGGQINLLEELSNLHNRQLGILVDALESIMEYKQWDDLSRSALEKLSNSQTTESSNP